MSSEYLSITQLQIGNSSAVSYVKESKNLKTQMKDTVTGEPTYRIFDFWGEGALIIFKFLSSIQIVCRHSNNAKTDTFNLAKVISANNPLSIL